MDCTRHDLVCKIVARGNKVSKEDMKRREYARIIPLVNILVRFVDTYSTYFMVTLLYICNTNPS